MQPTIDRWPAALLVAGLLGLGASAPAAAATETEAAAEAPDLSGSWKLDAARSDDLREKLREVRGGGRPGGFERPPGGMGGGMGGRRGGGMGGGMGGGRPGGGERRDGPGGERQGRREEMRALLAPRDLLTIVEAGDRFTLSGGEGIALVLPLDGGKVERELDGGGKVESRARRDGSRVVVESKGGSGLRVTDSYEVAADGATLTVTSKVELPRAGQPVIALRVYVQAPIEAAKPGEAGPAAAPPSEG